MTLLVRKVRVVWNEDRAYLCLHEPATSATPLGAVFTLA